MTEWLVKRFIKHADDTENPAVRTAYGTFASIVCIICNIVLCATKGLIGMAAGSLAIVADALNNLSDASSNIISFLGFKLASKPADKEHPYGHGRFEYLSSLAVAVLIIVIGIELIRSSVGKIIDPEPVEFSGALIGVLMLSIVVKLWMASFNTRLGSKIDSTTLAATAADSRNDVVATTAVLICTLIGEFGGIDLDGWAGLAVGGFIIYSGAGLVRDAIDPLLGKAPDPAFVQHIYDTITSYPGVIDTHDLIVHDYGPGRRFASAHVEMAAEMDPLKSHDVIDNIEEAFRSKENLLIVLHYDPIVTSDAAIGDLRTWISENIRRIDPRLTMHDLRIVPGPTHTNVIFDVLRPADFSISNDELVRRVEEIVKERQHDAVCKITIDSSYATSH